MGNEFKTMDDVNSGYQVGKSWSDPYEGGISDTSDMSNSRAGFKEIGSGTDIEEKAVKDPPEFSNSVSPPTPSPAQASTPPPPSTTPSASVPTPGTFGRMHENEEEFLPKNQKGTKALDILLKGFKELDDSMTVEKGSAEDYAKAVSEASGSSSSAEPSAPATPAPKPAPAPAPKPSGGIGGYFRGTTSAASKEVDEMNKGAKARDILLKGFEEIDNSLESKGLLSSGAKVAGGGLIGAGLGYAGGKKQGLSDLEEEKRRSYNEGVNDTLLKKRGQTASSVLGPKDFKIPHTKTKGIEIKGRSGGMILSPGAPTQVVEDKIARQRAESNARSLANTSASRGEELNRVKPALTDAHKYINSQEVSLGKQADRIAGQASRLRRGKIGAAIGVPLAVAGAYKLGSKNTEKGYGQKIISDVGRLGEALSSRGKVLSRANAKLPGGPPRAPYEDFKRGLKHDAGRAATYVGDKVAENPATSALIGAGLGGVVVGRKSKPDVDVIYNSKGIDGIKCLDNSLKMKGFETEEKGDVINFPGKIARTGRKINRATEGGLEKIGGAIKDKAKKVGQGIVDYHKKPMNAAFTGYATGVGAAKLDEHNRKKTEEAQAEKGWIGNRIGKLVKPYTEEAKTEMARHAGDIKGEIAKQGKRAVIAAGVGTGVGAGVGSGVGTYVGNKEEEKGIVMPSLQEKYTRGQAKFATGGKVKTKGIWRTPESEAGYKALQKEKEKLLEDIHEGMEVKGIAGEILSKLKPLTPLVDDVGLVGYRTYEGKDSQGKASTGAKKSVKKD